MGAIQSKDRQTVWQISAGTAINREIYHSIDEYLMVN